MATTKDGRYKKESSLRPRTHIAVSPEIHDVIRLFADQRNLEIMDATHKLIRIAIGLIYGEKLPESPRAKSEEISTEKPFTTNT